MSQSSQSDSRESNIYDRLGVRTVINAAGTFTDFGGSLMPPAVIAARSEAATHFVDLRELQDQVGLRLAALLKVEAALVTGGAAGGIMLGTAAAITMRCPEFVERTPEVPFEVLRQQSHRHEYDRQVEMCGVRIVEVETAEDVARAVNERTVMMLAYNLAEPLGPIPHAEWLALADRLSLPTLLDAAADTPPVENLWKFNRMGYDMVVFSGGKAIRGPQGSGLLLGRSDLIEAAKKNAVPNEGTVGRAVKVSKEDIVGLWTAVELFVASGDELYAQCDRRITRLQELLKPIPTLISCRIVPEVANHFPHLLIAWDEGQLEVTRAQLKDRLTKGTPSIVTGRVYGTGDQGFLISVVNLQDGEESIVAGRIIHILSSGSR
ncbi:MAG: aminotransferase class V-fold PLP-dependent enzyme [Planctomycetales bacterium]|nr:aminotransferase class V-fold PLP-dependent enzyme [Planctomycetales bacterium]